MCLELPTINQNTLWWQSAYILRAISGEREEESEGWLRWGSRGRWGDRLGQGHEDGPCEGHGPAGRLVRAPGTKAPDPPATQDHAFVYLCWLSLCPLEIKGQRFWTSSLANCNVTQNVKSSPPSWSKQWFQFILPCLKIPQPLLLADIPLDTESWDDLKCKCLDEVMVSQWNKK